MTELEGVIKYRIDHVTTDLPPTADIRQLNAWRSLLFSLQLIGRHPERYHGLGYGNISRRLVPGQPAFIISGTQTGHLQQLNRQHFAIVEAAWPEQNRLKSCGPCQPSSEALTHASIYGLAKQAEAVIHVHSPILWRHTVALGLPCTAANIAYGSVEMTAAVAQLFSAGDQGNLPILSMLGHQDGIVVFGNSVESAATLLITQLAKALAIEQLFQTG